MKHHFEIDIAVKHGIVEAILIDYFFFWCTINRDKGANLFEGRYWTYSSCRDLEEKFPYLTKSQITYALGKLVAAGALLKGNYNKKGYDRTSWYTLTDHVLQWCSALKAATGAISENSEMEFLKFRNGVENFQPPIPISKTDSKTNICDDDGLKILFAKPYNKLSTTDFKKQIEALKGRVLKDGKQYPDKMLDEFFEYWSETNAADIMKFQTQTHWKLLTRLKNWYEKQKEIDERFARQKELHEKRLNPNKQTSKTIDTNEYLKKREQEEKRFREKYGS